MIWSIPIRNKTQRHSDLVHLDVGEVLQTVVREYAFEAVYRVLVFFFFNDTATPEIYTLSLHDALPISPRAWSRTPAWPRPAPAGTSAPRGDRKSTRLNSSHVKSSYAVFCLKKKKN